MPACPTRDIRLDIDQSIERQVELVEIMDVEVSVDEERLFREELLPIADYDLCTVPSPDVSGCPVAKLQVIKRPPVLCSDAAAGKDELTRTRSPVRFPSQEPRQAPRQTEPSTTSGMSGMSIQISIVEVIS